MIIYKVTNKINGKCYIGQTIGALEKRKREHKYSMRNNSKCIFHKALRKYGIDNFLWSIIEYCGTKYELDMAEIWYIRMFRSNLYGYNMTEGGDYNPMLYDNIKEKQRNSLLISMKKFQGKNNVMKRPDIIEKHKISILKSMKRPDVIEKLKIRDDIQRKVYLIYTYCGREIIIKGLNNFCKLNNLSQSKMSLVNKGQRRIHKGLWCHEITDCLSLYNIKENIILDKDDMFIYDVSKIYTIIKPNSEKIIIKNLTQYCKKNNLNRYCMYTACSKGKVYKGYRCIKGEI